MGRLPGACVFVVATGSKFSARYHSWKNKVSVTTN